MWLAAAVVSGCAPSRPTVADRAEDADKEFESGADRRPSPQTLYTLARILASQGRDTECVGVLKRVIRESPDFLPAYYDMSEAQMRLHNPSGAIEVLQSGLRVSPHNAILWNNLGMCFLLERQYGQALDQFTMACGIEPASTSYRANLALALGFLGRYGEAMALYQQFLPPEEAHYNLGIICRAQSDPLRSQAEFQASGAAAPPPAVKAQPATAPAPAGGPPEVGPVASH